MGRTAEIAKLKRELEELKPLAESRDLTEIMIASSRLLLVLVKMADLQRRSWW